ncbi:MAG: hypothetical protein BAJATHORv1_40108 [Candidatus Thorarchaeota archaeon]|nr:MAG: hypothetical protein BAJATHORv1_40108 [Candidatus Thorarchaeota archaeon]
MKEAKTRLDDSSESVNSSRGTAILVATIIVVASIAAVVVIPRGLKIAASSVRVAVIDSGISDDENLGMAIVAQRSFINESYGYSISDTSTEDSNPDGIQHGTLVTKILLENSPNLAIINAKVVTSRNIATISGIIAAIQWAVAETECDVINLSLGSSMTSSEALSETIQWAFHRGVVIVAAAGNSGRGGIAGTSIESPALYSEVISVAAVDSDKKLFDFSGRGPLSDRTLKPDLCAVGTYTNGGGTVFGTSFATPVVSAAAADIIRYCKINELRWTPGMVKASLMQGAQDLDYEVWEVGAGLVDSEFSLRFIESVSKVDNLPMIAYVTPNLNPFEFERWYVNTSILLSISIFCSEYAEFNIEYSGSASDYISGPTRLFVNQSRTFEIELFVNSSIKILNLQGVVYFTAEDYRNIWSQFRFDANIPRAWVAFDFSHTSWSIDSIYGQFRQFYEALSRLNISVEAIHDRQDIVTINLQRFDAILKFDPCSWKFTNIGNTIILNESLSITREEIAVYQEYWELGGNMMVLGLSSKYLDISSANLFLSRFGFLLNNDSIPAVTTFVSGIPSTIEVTDISSHEIMEGIISFDYNGCSLHAFEDSEILARTDVVFENSSGVFTESRSLLGYRSNGTFGKILVSGSNFFLDNFGMSGYYQSNQNLQLGYQSVYWLLGIA